LIDKIKTLPNCFVHPQTGIPDVEEEHTLPGDLKEFYNICGGIDLFIDCDYAIKIVFSQGFGRSNRCSCRSLAYEIH
jgi:antitoxin YokJ